MIKNNSQLKIRTVTALVNDKPGVLNRITSMLRRRGFNIQSLAVGHSEIDNLSRLTVIVEGGDDIVEKITKQLHKLIDVIKVNDISDDNIVSRELALIKITSTPSTRNEIIQLVSIYRAKIVDVSANSIIIEATGDDQ
jgi:acetolactate synthase-1/3 small subunit